MNKETVEVENGNAEGVSASGGSRSSAQVMAWLEDYLAKTLKINRSEVNVDTKFDRYSVDSLMIVVMTEDLSEWLGAPVDPTAPYEHPTIRSLAEHVSRER
jgi:acyl carrier protein